MFSVHAPAFAADSQSMRQGEAFADVLQRELQRSSAVPEARGSAWQTSWAASPNPFLFVTAQPLTASGPAPRPASATFASTDRPQFAAAEAAPRPSPTSSRPVGRPAAPTQAPELDSRTRVLMAREQRALRELIARGAELDANFSGAELRHAFRILARRYHPDGHPAGDASEHASLARTFSEIAENYRCLVAVVESVGPIRH